MKILAFAGSNSSTSINKKLVTYVATFFDTDEVEIIDLRDYEMPIYSSDREKEGIPQLASDFQQKIEDCDIIILSLPEQNGSYSVAFKNVFDWTSRLALFQRRFFRNKPIFLMSAAPGKRGGRSILRTAEGQFPHNGAGFIETFSLPGFEKNFEEGKGIVNEELNNELKEKLENFRNNIKSRIY